jgi:hypothetical protein
MKRATYIRCEGPMPRFTDKLVPGLPPIWKVFPADHTNKPTGKIYEKPAWLEALLLMRRIARDRQMPFASFVQNTGGTFKRYPPPLY